MTLFLQWETDEQVFTNWRYAGDGITVPQFKTRTKRTRARYSNEDTPEMRRKAWQYIWSDRPDALLILVTEEGEEFIEPPDDLF